MLDGAKSVISIAGAIAAALLILWLIGISTHHGAHGMAAVGDGIAAVFGAAGSLISQIHF